MNEPTLSIVAVETFAAVSSSGVRASVGNSAASAGWNAVPQIGPKAARKKTRTIGPWAKTTSAIELTRSARSTSAASITRSWRKRSPNPETNGASTAAGIVRTRAITPTEVAPPCR